MVVGLFAGRAGRYTYEQQVLLEKLWYAWSALDNVADEYGYRNEIANERAEARWVEFEKARAQIDAENAAPDVRFEELQQDIDQFMPGQP